MSTIGLTPERIELRDYYREHISQYIARVAVAPLLENPVNIGYDETEVDS
jgi:hypothetical protein